MASRALGLAACALALASTCAFAKGRNAEIDDLLKNEDPLARNAERRPPPSKPSRTWDQVLQMALREGRPGTVPEAAASLLGISPKAPSKNLAFTVKLKGGGSAEHRLQLLISLDPSSGEAIAREVALTLRRVVPKGRTEWEERTYMRLDLEQGLGKAAYGYGRILMVEDKPLAPGSAKARKLLDEELRFYLSESAGLRPDK